MPPIRLRQTIRRTCPIATNDKGLRTYLAPRAWLNQVDLQRKLATESFDQPESAARSHHGLHRI